jgi:hypothetical protein
MPPPTEPDGWNATHQARAGQRAQGVMVIRSAIAAILLDRDLGDIFIDGERLQYRRPKPARRTEFPAA